MKPPYPPRKEQRCGNCFYVVVYDKDITLGDEVYECRRKAPAPLTGAESDLDAYWPDVASDCWCGEWAPQEVPT
jgi:hypothetical protein